MKKNLSGKFYQEQERGKKKGKISGFSKNAGMKGRKYIKAVWNE